MSEKQRKCSICAGDMLPWDNHQACLKCRNDKKGKDKCVIGKESDCTICPGALKIPHRKKSSKTKVSDKFDDSLLDEPTPSKSSTSSTSTPDSSLQEMLKAMNSQLSSLASQFEEFKRRDKPSASKTTLPHSQEQGMCAPASQSRPVPSEGELSDEESSLPATKRHRSRSPQGDSDTHSQELDPSYVEMLNAIRNLLDLEVPQVECLAFSKKPSKQVVRKQNLALPPVQDIQSILSEQRRRHTFHRNVCSYLENSCIHKFQKNPDKGKTRTWIPKCHSRLSITKGQGHTDGVVTSPTDIQPNLQSLAHTNGRSICNSSKLQTSNLCISCPRQKGLENRCIEYLLGRPRRLCLLSSSHPATSNSKNNNIPMQDDSTGSRVAGDAMVLGSGGSLDQGTPTAPSLEDTSETATFQQVPQQRGVPESTCVASGFQESNSGRFSSEVAERIKAPQRESSRKVYQSRWTIYGQWCTENKVDITSTAVPQVAEFLNYLFTVKNLKPATITGYRTAIADALGSQGEFISKSLELNRLIASFTRDRPKPNRSIPTWDLSLVLLGLTKPSFEPLSEAPLKWLTYKTVFLLALASGKRRSEIHAWTHSSVSSRRNWSEVTVSPAFLAKNQLASDGPDSIKPVVIPALTTMLDSSLVEDKSLCPVRALKVYLQKTKSMRKGKALLFVSLREGYSKDITRITISQWIKHTIQTCYQSSDTADQQVTQVRAHDVRAMAASLAFKGGISLEQVLSSCYWKSHNTFTNFYLKDICWENDDIFKLGPIVSAQHVVNN